MQEEGRSAWEVALRQLLDCAYSELARRGVEWAIIGSAATALQGCAVAPRDIDIVVREPGDVAVFADLLRAFVPATWQAGAGDGAEEWLSSEAQAVESGPDDYGFVWHFGRWYVGGVKVEVAHIAPPAGFAMSEEGGGIWEAGPELWPHLRRVVVAGYEFAVAPLEIQLATSVGRGLAGRVDEIVAVLGARGFDAGLLRRAVRKDQRGVVGGLLGVGVDELR